MADSNTPPSLLPAYIGETIETIAKIHADHHSSATPFQRSVDTITAAIAKPATLGIVTLALIAWVVFNLLAPTLGIHAIDRPPFPWAGEAASVISLYLAILILATQRREDQIAQHREQLTLELAILSEQKAAKIIQLLEELRRDDPFIGDRIDEQAEAMGQPADARSVLDVIRDVHSEAERTTSAAVEPAAPGNEPTG